MSTDLGAISARLTLNIDNFSSNLRRAEEEIKNTEKQFSGFTDIGKRFENIGQKLTLGLTLPIAGIGVAASKAGMDFEAQMSRVSAISGATGENLDKLKEQAMQLGADTAFSSKQAAEGMENLASAGFNVTEIMQAMPGMLDLAASDNIEIAQAADIAASALRGFGLEASQAGHVADVMAKAAADTNAGILDMGEAMKYIAPVANAMGISLEETSAAIGLMSNAGIQGSQAGTTLRSALTRLTNPSKEARDLMKFLGINAFDSKGKMKDLGDIIGIFAEKTKKLTQEQKQRAIAEIFGQEAMSGMLVLMDQGKNNIDKLTASFENSNGSAKTMAATMQDNVKGALDQMGGSLETAGIKLGEALAPTIRDVANTITGLTNKFSALEPETQKNIVKFGLLAASVGPMVMMFGSLMGSITKISGGLTLLSGLFGRAAIASGGVTAGAAAASSGVVGMGLSLGRIIALAGPYALAAGAIAAAGYGIYKVMTKQVTPSVDLFADSIKTTTNVAKSANGTLITSYGQTTVKISESTKKAVGAYIELDKKATQSLNDLYMSSDKITSKNSKTLIDTYTQMNKQIISGFDQHYKERTNYLQGFFKKSSALTETEEKEILAKEKYFNNERKASQQEFNDKILAIVKRATQEKRGITAEEMQEINRYQNNMTQNAVEALSKQEIESKVILERLKGYSGHITAEQSSETIANAEKQRAEAVAKAEQTYNDSVANFIRMRDETGELTAEQADKLIKEAERQRKESIDKAQLLKDGVVKKITEMNSEVGKSVDLTTGDMLTKWDKFQNWWNNVFHLDRKTTSVEVQEPQNVSGRIGGIQKAYASGTDSHPGGLAVAGEEGEELVIGPNGELGLTAGVATLYNLPKGTKVVPHNKTKNFLSSLNVPGYKDGIGVSNTNDKAKQQDLVSKIQDRFTVSYSNIELALIKLGVNTKNFTEEIKQQQSEIEILNKKLSLMKNEYNAIVKVAGANSQEALTLRNNIASLSVEITNSTQDMKDKIEENAKEAKEKLVSEAKEAKEKLISETNDLVERIKTALQRKYKEEEEQQEASLQRQLDKLDKWREKSEQRINSVYDTKIKAIEDSTNATVNALEAEIAALDKQAEQQERAIQDQEQLANIQKLQDAIAYEHNDFNKAELQKQLNQALAEREKTLNERVLEDKKESLENEIKQIQEKADKEKEILETQRNRELENIDRLYKSKKANLDKQLKDVKDFYAKKTEEANIQAEAEKLIMDNNQKAIVALLHSYEEHYEVAGQSLGERLVNGFKPKVNEIQNLIDSLADRLASLKSDAANALSSSRSSSSSSVNWYATGAIFDKPSVIGVGEAGPEVVIPIEKLGGILREALSDIKLEGNSGNTYVANITSPIAKTPSQERRAYESMMRKLAFEMR